MIPKTKTGDCSNPSCNAKNVACVKVGKNLFCVKCRQYDRVTAILKKAQERTFRASPQRGEVERSYLVEDLDLIASKYIRKKYANNKGEAECYTCGKSEPWQNLDCGHFIPRHNMSLRWDTRNLRPQCKECNQYKSGNLIMFANKLEKEQPGITEQLESEAREVKKWTRQELKETLIDLRYKLKNVSHKL